MKEKNMYERPDLSQVAFEVEAGFSTSPTPGLPDHSGSQVEPVLPDDEVHY